MPQPKTRSAQINLKDLDKVVDERLGEHFQSMISMRKLLWRSFLQGAFAGLGGVIGATIGAALLVAILLRFGNIPVVGQYLENAGQKIQQGHVK